MQNVIRSAGVLLVIAVSAWWYAHDQAGAARPRDDDRVTHGGRGGGDGGGGGGGGGARHRMGGPVAVLVATVGRQDVPVHLEGIGTVQAFNTVTVRAQVDGQLERVAFTEGQDVKAGDILAQIDPRPYQARLTQAQGAKAKDEAQLANVKLDLERYLKLGQYATQQSVDTQRALVRQLEASLQADQAAIDSATVELGYTTIKAPISGRTGVRLIDQGNIVRAGDMNGIVVITQLQPISVVFSLPQQHLVPVNEALAKSKVPVTALDAEGKNAWEEGVLSVVDNRIDPQTGTIKLKATFANAAGRLWPGQFVNVRVRLGTHKDGIVAPATAVQRNGDGPFAYVLTPENTVEMRPIRVAQIDRGMALIEAGVESGEKVVVTSQEQLRPGARVIASEDAPALEARRDASPNLTSSAGPPDLVPRQREQARRRP